MFSDPSKNILRLGINHGMRVVDLGAGSGFYSINAARIAGMDGRVYAVDVQKDLLDRIRSVGAAEGLRNIEVVWGNAEKVGGTRLREGIADRVIASNLLFQIEKPDDFVLEIKRLLKPGGKVMVIDWSHLSPLSPKNIVDAGTAQALFEKAGFQLDQKFDAGEHHYGFVFIR